MCPSINFYQLLPLCTSRLKFGIIILHMRTRKLAQCVTMEDADGQELWGCPWGRPRLLTDTALQY